MFLELQYHSYFALVLLLAGREYLDILWSFILYCLLYLVSVLFIGFLSSIFVFLLNISVNMLGMNCGLGVYVMRTKLMTFPCRFAINLDYRHFFDILIFLIMTPMLVSGNVTIAQLQIQWNGSFLHCQSLFSRWNGSFIYTIDNYVIFTKMFLWYSILFYFRWLFQSNRFGYSLDTIIHMGRTP